ncbi:hypothetical protein DSM112329_00759 [Paraconexibacter sp. AEG42_29]|uniref:Uncharacterized protein n=1 Tax=Paraconexibacter sp. AEG42_29 TaxID=2997339 RepID=A0AAU7AQQ0_9ACTN
MTELRISPSHRTPDATPIACSLDARDYAERLAQMTALGAEALIDSRRDGAHAELRFTAVPGGRDRVAAIAAAEEECCAFLHMKVVDEPNEVKLTIDGPADAAVVIEDLVDAFRGPERPLRTSRVPVKVVGKSGAAVAGASVLMVLCCAVGPAVLGAVAGAMIGGWFGIAAAVLVAVGVGLGVQRRKGASGTGSCSCSC